MEYVCYMMRRRWENLLHPLQTLEAIQNKVQMTSNTISQEDINILIQSMPRKLNECFEKGQDYNKTIAMLYNPKIIFQGKRYERLGCLRKSKKYESKSIIMEIGWFF